MLEATELECTRGERRLFRDLSLRVDAGQCLYVAGANGAGKTSLLRILAGLLLPQSGAVRWRGRDIARAREEFGSDLAFVGHLNGIKDELTALENVRFAAALRGADASEAAAMGALARMHLADYCDVFARHLSQGQKRRLALTRVCVADPPVLWILDEPYNALDAAAVESLQALLDAHLAAGGMVVLTAHQQVAMPSGAHRLELNPGHGQAAGRGES
jgi:heme exporter protein A